MSTPLPPPEPEWLPNGFPPRTFPVPGSQAPPPRMVTPPKKLASQTRRDPGQAAAFAVGVIVIVVVVVAGVVFATSRNEKDTAIRDPETTTTLDTTTPSVTPTEAPITAAPSLTTRLVDTTTSAVGRAVLAIATTDLTLPRTDATAGPSQAPLIIRNTGTVDLTYTAESTTAGLRVSPTGGLLVAGSTATLMVTLEGAQVATEGPFTGKITLGGTGGTGTVQVNSTVGRPPDITADVGENCASPSAICARAIKLAPTDAPDASPCNTPWVYAVTIADPSKIQSARVIARRGLANADMALERAGTSNIFLSTPIMPLPSDLVLRFTIEAIDEFGFTRRIPEQSIACP